MQDERSISRPSLIHPCSKVDDRFREPISTNDNDDTSKKEPKMTRPYGSRSLALSSESRFHICKYIDGRERIKNVSTFRRDLAPTLTLRQHSHENA
jgi:hypothetical protein